MHVHQGHHHADSGGINVAEVVSGASAAQALAEILHQVGSKKILLVCGSSFRLLPFGKEIEHLSSHAVFCDFSPNPRYEDACLGVARFREEAPIERIDIVAVRH